MKEKIMHLSLLLFIVLLGLVWRPYPMSEQMGMSENYFGIAWAQTSEKEGKDSHYVQMMRQFRAKVDAWLKDLNERIENRNVTRFEVRFLEIFRSILEWIGEKIDGQIESGEKKTKKKVKGKDV